MILGLDYFSYSNNKFLARYRVYFFAHKEDFELSLHIFWDPNYELCCSKIYSCKSLGRI